MRPRMLSRAAAALAVALVGVLLAGTPRPAAAQNLLAGRWDGQAPGLAGCLLQSTLAGITKGIGTGLAGLPKSNPRLALAYGALTVLECNVTAASGDKAKVQRAILRSQKQLFGAYTAAYEQRLAVQKGETPGTAVEQQARTFRGMPVGAATAGFFATFAREAQAAQGGSVQARAATALGRTLSQANIRRDLFGTGSVVDGGGAGAAQADAAAATVELALQAEDEAADAARFQSLLTAQYGREVPNSGRSAQYEALSAFRSAHALTTEQKREAEALRVLADEMSSKHASPYARVRDLRRSAW